MPTNPKILVAGSLNMDITMAVDVLPPPGASSLGDSYCYNPGGKGGNGYAAIFY